MDCLHNHLPPSSDMVFPVRPHPDEPGTFEDQLRIVNLWLENPWAEPDAERRWAMARRVILQHARRPAR